MNVEFLKLKNVLVDRHKILILILGMIFVLSGLWIYDISKPVYKDKKEVVSSYTDHGFYTYTVPVTKTNPLYPVGTTLKMGMPAYFFVVSPNIDMSFTYRFESADPADISGKLETMIVATHTGESGTEASETVNVETGGGSTTDVAETNKSTNEENILWQKEFPLGPQGGDSWNGLSVTKKFSLDVSEIQLKVKKLQAKLNDSGEPTIEIVNRVTYTGKINGENIQGTKDFAMPLVIKGTSYFQLNGKPDVTQSANITRNVSVKSYPPLSKMILPLSLCLLSLVLLGTTLVCTKTGKVESELIEKLEKEEKRSSFKDFISRGKLPQDRNSLLQIEISSLQELVDAASDMNSRVIYDETAETYFIINNGVIYIFLDRLEGNSNPILED